MTSLRVLCVCARVDSPTWTGGEGFTLNRFWINGLVNPSD